MDKRSTISVERFTMGAGHRVWSAQSARLGDHRKGFVKRSLPDSGATISILRLQAAKKMNLDLASTKLKHTNATVIEWQRKARHICTYLCLEVQ